MCVGVKGGTEVTLGVVGLVVGWLATVENILVMVYKMVVENLVAVH